MAEEQMRFIPADKVNVLGTEYKIILGDERTYPKLKDATGICEKYTKEIIMDTSGYQDSEAFNNLYAFDQNTLRHELAHAFMHESGFDGNLTYDQEERIAGWMAQMLPKYYQACKETRAFDNPTELIMKAPEEK